MRYHRTVLASAMALLLLTCTSCSVEQLDTDGDGLISKSEFFAAVFDAVCGNESEPTDETPTDETPTDETPADETPVDETPADEAPAVDNLDAGTGR